MLFSVMNVIGPDKSSSNEDYLTKSSSSSRKGNLVIVDTPKGLDFGIDLMNHEIGPTFLGIQGIPAGLHLVYFSTGMGAREAFFINMHAGDVCVKSWNKRTEEIMMLPELPENALANLVASVRSGVPEVWGRLGPYAMDKSQHWLRLTCFVDDDVLARAGCGPGCKITPGEMKVAGERSPYSAASAKFRPNPQDDVPSAEQTHVPAFTPVRDVERALHKETLASANATGGVDAGTSVAAMTAMGLDKTRLLDRLRREYYGGSYVALLGELQLSFVLFLLLHSYPALEAWKTLLSTCAACETLFHHDSNFTCALLRLIHSQLSFVPEDIFEAELSEQNFLQRVLSDLFQSLDGAGFTADVVEHRQRLLLYVRRRFNYLDSEEAEGASFSGEALNIVDEDQPMVVDPAEAEGVAEFMSPACSTGGASIVSEESSDAEGDRAQYLDRAAAIGSAIDARAKEHGHTTLTQDQRMSPYSPVLSPVHADTHTALPIAASCQSQSGGQRSQSDEETLFGWRYPALSTARTANEDYVMCCARLLEGVCMGSEAINGVDAAAAVAEARLFLEVEVGRGVLA